MKRLLSPSAVVVVLAEKPREFVLAGAGVETICSFSSFPEDAVQRDVHGCRWGSNG